MFIAEHLGTLFLLLLCGLLSGVGVQQLQLIATVATLAIFGYLLYRWWYYTTVRWEISSTQVKSVSGIFLRSINYLELYRVNDFSEQQNFIQQILSVKDIYIMSSDRSHPILRIYGISAEIDLIPQIKPLVKQCRKENQIYEMANR